MTLKIKYLECNKKPVQAGVVVRVDAKKVCLMLGCSGPHLYNLQKSPSFPQPKFLGKKRLWLRSEVENWLEKNLSDASAHSSGIANIERAA